MTERRQRVDDVPCENTLGDAGHAAGVRLTDRRHDGHTQPDGQTAGHARVQGKRAVGRGRLGDRQPRERAEPRGREGKGD